MNKRKNNTSPLKIAVLGHKTIPSRQGGIEIVVEELTVRMAKLGHKITVYNRNGHHVSGKEFDEKKLKEYKGIRMKYVPTIDKKGLAAMSASFFAAVAAAFGKYDVVHFHVEILFNSIEKIIAVRPCEKDNVNAVRWGTIRKGKWAVLPKSCRGFSQPLYELMDWNGDCKYRFRGQYSKSADGQIFLFNLEEPEIIQRETIENIVL